MLDEKILTQFEIERQPVECWTRVMGCFRPISGYSKGKQAEFKERKWYMEKFLKSGKIMGK